MDRRGPMPRWARRVGIGCALFVIVFSPATPGASASVAGEPREHTAVLGEVSDGDTIDKVAALCGPPTDIQRREVLRRPIQWYSGRPYYTSYEPVAIPIEYWIYNLGPNKLMRRLKFEDGLLVDVETLSHGYYSERDD